MKFHRFPSLATTALALVLAAPIVHGEDALGLLAMLPPPDSGDCSNDGATMQKRHATMAAFHKAYDRAYQRFQQTQQDVTSKRGGARMDVNTLFKLRDWMNAPGQVNLRQRAADLFDPPRAEAQQKLSPIAKKLSDLDNCACATLEQLQAVVDTARPVMVKWAGSLHQAWGQYVDAVKQDIAWTARPLPPDLDPKDPQVASQVVSLRGQALQDVREAASQADQWFCVETAHMSSSLISSNGGL